MVKSPGLESGYRWFESNLPDHFAFKIFMDKQTLAKEYQTLLYGLFQEKLFNLEGVKLSDETGCSDDYILKSTIIDGAVEILNEIGELMSTDKRLSNEASN